MPRRTKRKVTTLVFAGSGDVSYENAKTLLNDFLGVEGEDANGYPVFAASQEAIYPIVVMDSGSLADGLKNVLDWIEYADLGFTAILPETGGVARAVTKAVADAEETIITSNVPAQVVKALKDAEGDVHVVLLWGEGDEQTEALLDAVLAAGFPAKDLTAGLDDIAFDDESEPAAEPEPEPVQEDEPKPRGRRSRAAVADAPLEQPEVALDEDEKPGDTDDAGSPDEAQSALPLVAQGGEHAARLAKAYETCLHLAITLDSALDAVRAHAEVLLAVMGQDGAEPAKDEAQEPQDEAKPRRGRGRPRKDGTPAQPRSEEERAAKEVLNEETGQWEPRGRGRPRSGSRTRVVK